MTDNALERQVDRLWLQPEDDLYTTLGINQQAVETAEKNNDAAQLERAEHYDTVFSAADTEMGALDDLKAFGKMWWAELEPEVFDLLCNKENSEHDVLMDALTEGAKMLAIALIPALVAQVVALPAVAIIIATIAAKKIADAGLEAACKTWKQSIEEAEKE